MSGPQETDPDIITTTTPPEEGMYGGFGIKHQIDEISMDEVRRWKQARPELFEGEDHENWRRWTIDTLAKGIDSVGATGDEVTVRKYLP